MATPLEIHLLGRHYDSSLYKHQMLYQPDPDFLCGSVLTVDLHNLSGQCVGFQQYRPDVLSKKCNDPRDSRYFTYTPKGVNAVWGLETLDRLKPDLYIVEGLFKASTLHMLGYNAVAVLGATPKPMRQWLSLMPYNLIAIGDNDKAGEKLVGMFGGFTLDKDLDEYTLEELREILCTIHQTKVGC